MMRPRVGKRHRHPASAAAQDGLMRLLSDKRFWVACLLATLLSALTITHAAAQIGLRLPFAEPLGGSFYAWRAEQAQLEQRIVRNPRRAARLDARSAGLAILQHTPLSPRALWSVGMDYSARGQTAGARRAMTQAQALSRREPPVQLWLAENAARREDAATALGHLDLILRTRREGSAQIINRMIAVLPNPDARAALLPYLRRDNVWRADFINLASQRGRSAEPFARLLIASPTPLSATLSDRLAYRLVLIRLAGEERYDLMTALYRRLPGADAARLSGLAIDADGAYQPIDWAFPEGRPTSGEVVLLGRNSPALDLYAAAGTSGTAAVRYVRPAGATRLFWRVVERNDNAESDARMIVRCVAGPGAGSVQQSANLLPPLSRSNRSALSEAMAEESDEVAAPTNRNFVMNIPRNCTLVRLEVSMIGGTGREPASIVIDRLRFAR
jgi:hypothetical protein